jgi:putative transcriptional regulator
MKDIHTYKLDKLPVGTTDWSRVAKLSDKEIEAAARLDKDAKPTTKKQLMGFKKVNSLQADDIKQIRKRLNMSQVAFAAYFGISARTLQEWEQGRRQPEGSACTLLIVINYEPEAVERALAR